MQVQTITFAEDLVTPEDRGGAPGAGSFASTVERIERGRRPRAGMRSVEFIDRSGLDALASALTGVARDGNLKIASLIAEGRSMFEMAAPAGSSPSWSNAAAADVLAVTALDTALDLLLREVQDVFVARPRLPLTAWQVARLCGMDVWTADGLLASLTRAGFLHRTAGGAFQAAPCPAVR